MARQAGKKTDFGTVMTHLATLIALPFALVCGLRMTPYSPGYDWLPRLDSFLLGTMTWSWHLLFGLGLTAVSLGYVAHIKSAGLTHRTRFGKARPMAVLAPQTACREAAFDPSQTAQTGQIRMMRTELE